MTNKHEATPNPTNQERPAYFLGDLAVDTLVDELFEQAPQATSLHIEVEQSADEGQPVTVRHE